MEIPKKLRPLVRQILQQIRRRRPKDLERIEDRLTAIRFASWEDGTQGQVVRKERATAEDPSTWGLDPSCEVLLHEDILSWPVWVQRATLAHEFGHVATTDETLERRKAPEDEWASEVAADWYAYRWGFGREIAKGRPERIWVHHACAPRSWIEIYGKRFRLSRSFVFHRIT